MFRTHNLFHQHKLLFQNLAKELFNNVDGCLGVTLGGGIGRGWYDGVNRQDIDIYLFVDSTSYRKYINLPGSHPEWSWVIDFHIDGFFPSIQFLDYHQLAKAPLEPKIWIADDHRWTQSNRWEKSFNQSWIDSEGALRHLFEQKIKFPNEEQVYLRKMYTTSINNAYFVDVQTYQLRGLYAEANLKLNYCIGQLVHWIYINNKLFVPPDKWLYWWLRDNPVLQSQFWNNICESMIVGKFDCNDNLRKRQEKFQYLCSQTSFHLNAVSSTQSVDQVPKFISQPIASVLSKWRNSEQK
ncbi:MAG: hypothetical protein GY861_11145 [bacterium]|nr:hypothetical protein [bacterium]